MKTTTAILLAVCVSTACATIPLALLGGHLTPLIAWASFAAGLAAAVIYWLTSGPGGEPVKMTWVEWSAVTLFALVSLRAFCWLIFTSELPGGSGATINVLSPNNLGDIALHLTYIRYIAKGVRFWPDNPIFSGVPLHYPAGIDIFNAMLHVVGCDDYRALIWVGLAGCALTCYALLRWGRWFAVAGFLCNGGFAGFRFFHHWRFVLEDFENVMEWKNFFLSMLVTQRGLLYAIPAGLLLLSRWRSRWFRAQPEVRMPLWVEVVLYGTMPLFHLHTFLFLSALLGWWLVQSMLSRQLRPAEKGSSRTQEILDIVLWAVLPATASVSLVTGLFQKGQGVGHFMHVKVGWMQGEDTFFRFWFMNFGILPLLALALLAWIGWRFRKEKTAALASFAFVVPALLVFLTTCFVSFAPWEWDNMKLMIWSYLCLLPFLHEMLTSMPRPYGEPARSVCYVLLFFTGFASLLGGLDGRYKGYDIAKPSELDAVDFAVRFLPPGRDFCRLADLQSSPAPVRLQDGGRLRRASLQPRHRL